MDRDNELYRARKVELTRSDGLVVTYGNAPGMGVFVLVEDPGAWNDDGDASVLVDVCEAFEGASAVQAAFDKWVLA